MQNYVILMTRQNQSMLNYNLLEYWFSTSIANFLDTIARDLSFLSKIPVAMPYWLPCSQLMLNLQALISILIGVPTFWRHPEIAAALLKLYQHILTERYLYQQRALKDVHTQSLHTSGAFMLRLAPVDFKREFRMTKLTFDSKLSLIQNHEVFEKQPMGRPQAPVELRLAVTIWCMTHNGNGASTSVVAQTFGCAGMLVSE
jgi:hypothetical protein